MNRIFRAILNFLPFANPVPTKTFLRRSMAKNRRNLSVLASRLGFVGARRVGKSRNGNTVLKLNRKTALGERGALLEIPQDNMIYWHIKNYGVWEEEECLYLAGLLNRYSAGQNQILGAEKTTDNAVTFLDLGANSGLVSLQVIALAETKCSVIMVEPILSHVEAIQFNIKTLNDSVDISIHNFALGAENGKFSIFTQKSSRGNSSLFKTVVGSDFEENFIEVVETKGFCERYLNTQNSFVIKSDLQGFDAAVLSRIPKNVWKQTKGAVVEVWALPEVLPSDVLAIENLWKDFSSMSWQSDFTDLINFRDISDFWLSKSGKQKNLFLKR